jgi:regulator of protease activity HflC (stomatin/prohibitin superfamily)
VAFILLAVAVVLALVGTQVFDGDRGLPGITVKFRKWALVPFVLGLFFLLIACIRVVAPGEVGIPVVFGTAKSQVGAGINFVNPFTSVKKLSVRTEQYTMSHSTDEGNKKGDDSVEVLGKDGATGKVDATVLYRLDEKSASKVYREVGTSYVDKLVRPTTRTCIRSGFSDETMIAAATTSRQPISLNIEKCIKDAIEPRGIILEAFQLRDVRLSQTVQDSIDAKVKAEQSAAQQSFELDKTRQQADIRRVEAQGLADSQSVIQKTLTPEYLQYEYIKALQAMVNAPNNSTLVLPMDPKLTPQFVLPDQKK